MKEDIQTKVKLCVVTTIVGIVIVGVWGILLNVILLYNLPQVSYKLQSILFNINQARSTAKLPCMHLLHRALIL
jgi:hypothetical protein